MTLRQLVGLVFALQEGLALDVTNGTAHLDEHDVGQTLDEQLADAIADEKYELAADIRDKIRRRDSPLN